MLSIFSSRVSVRSLEKTHLHFTLVSLARFFSVLYTSVIVVPISCSTFRRLGYLASKIYFAIVTMFTKPRAMTFVNKKFPALPGGNALGVIGYQYTPFFSPEISIYLKMQNG